MLHSTPKQAGGFFFGRRHRNVTVIEANIHYASARRAKLAFWITASVVGILTATVAANNMHPILALLLGVLVGGICGAIAWVIARIWPVLQRLWWWAPQIVLAVGVAYGFTALANTTDTITTGVVVALVVGVPAVVPAFRRRVWALTMCQVVRHRLRMAFSDFIKTNQHGTLPLILWARPTPAGERVWVFLRPGLSKPDLDTRLDKLAVACFANTVTIERASAGNSAYLRFDISRRDVLRATVKSPLMAHVDPNTPTVPRQPMTAPDALDLRDVAEQPSPMNTRYKPDSARKDAKDVKATDNDTSVKTDGDDISQWL